MPEKVIMHGQQDGSVPKLTQTSFFIYLLAVIEHLLSLAVDKITTYY